MPTNPGLRTVYIQDKKRKSQSALPSIEDEPGQKLRKARERLMLRYRDVVEASQRIARRRGNQEFIVGLSRLADIENHGTTPSLYRLYSLCAIYRLEFHAALRWYGIELGSLHSDGATIELNATHLAAFDGSSKAEIEYPIAFDSSFDPRQTDYISPYIQRWGKVSLALLPGLTGGQYRFGFIGTDDWSMYPILTPGSFIQIDQTKRKILNKGWANEFERPIYFLEHRSGFRCCWCCTQGELIIAQSHSSSSILPEIFRSKEIDVVGQVVGVAKRLDLVKRRRIRSSINPE